MAPFHTDHQNILVVNNECVNLAIFDGGQASKKPEILDDLRKAKRRRVYTEQQGGTLSIVKISPYNRRTTADFPKR